MSYLGSLILAPATLDSTGAYNHLQLKEIEILKKHDVLFQMR